MPKHSDYQLIPVAYCGNCPCLASDDYVLLSLRELIIEIMKHSVVPTYLTIICNTQSAAKTEFSKGCWYFFRQYISQCPDERNMEVGIHRQ